MQISEDNAVAALCKASFFDFVQEFWEVIIPEDPVWNWHIKYICDEVQKCAERVFENKYKEHDLVVNVPPGSTKSTIFSRMFPAWAWTRMPSFKSICVSYSQSLSLGFSLHTRDIVESEKYQRLFPEVKLRHDQNTKTSMWTTKGGFRAAASVGSALTGMHGHMILVDDPVNVKQASSKLEMQTANDWMQQTLSSRKVDKNNSPTVLIMQRLHQNDPSANMVERGTKKGKLKHICLPATITDNVTPKKLRRYYKDGYLFPERIGKEACEEALVDLGQYAYAGQYQQDPVPAGGGQFHVDKLKYHDHEYGIVRRVRAWDKAATPGDGDYTSGTLVGQDSVGEWWILDQVRGKWDSSVRERNIVKTAEMDGHDVDIVLEQEPGSGGKESAQATVRRLAGYKVFVYRPTGEKHVRADPFATQMNMGNVNILRRSWTKDFVEEYRFFPMGTNDDQVDSGSAGFNHMHQKKRIVKAY